ncbi:hypothetical protein [Muricoccus vinaceus]|uniref:DUF1508 domain-containing protein n=1 Tax=Muricoccus vinaceus TaxID=424704 RepID=A0ABV6J130_9PROT
MALGDQGLAQVQVLVERSGSGAEPWRWRLASGHQSIAASTRGFVSAENAHAAAKAKLLELKAKRALSALGL